MDLANNRDLTICNLAPLIRRKKISPVELTQALLARIERLQPRLNAFITVTADHALTQAKKAEKAIARGNYLGPLHGIPICLKDMFLTEGIRTTAGSRILSKFVPDGSGAVVERLNEAGAILLGKTNLHEFAYGCTNINPHFGSTHNPWNLKRMTGGSSGGSAAAVASGMSVASLGTDTGGSIRIPSAACGCVGLKPSYGRVPLCGVIPLASSLDHVGPITRCVEDAAIMLEAVAGCDECDPTSFGAHGQRLIRDLKKGIAGLRVGVPKHFFFDRLQKEVRWNVNAAIELLEQNGAEICEVNFDLIGETDRLAGEITLAEALPYHAQWIQKRPKDYGKDLRSRLTEGMSLTALAYLQAQECRQAYAAEFDFVLDSVDLLVTPTLPIAAPLLEEEEVLLGRTKESVRLALLRLTRPGNLTGLPAISVPCGLTSEGLPIGLQFIGRREDENTVLRAAYAYERLTPWHEMFPMAGSDGE